MSSLISINGRKIGADYSPYIIAEMSANHNGSIDNAYKIIDMAKKSGADAIKLQTYTPDTITMNIKNNDFIINEGLWSGKSLYELYEEAFMPWEWHKPLFDYANKLNITIFSSPFDITAITNKSVFLFISSDNFSNFKNLTFSGTLQSRVGCFFFELIISIKSFSK